MSNQNKFIKSELSERQEDKYLNKLFDKHYDEELKEKYSGVLESEHNVSRSTPLKNSNKKAIIRSLKFLGSIAAMLLLFLIVKPLFDSTNSPINLASNHIANEVFVNQGVKRGESISDLNRQKAILAYNGNNYSSALSFYDNILNKTDEDKFFNALAFMYVDQFDKAIEMFKSIQKIESFKFSQETKWYLSLSLIKTENFSEAQKLLIQIDGWKEAEIKELLEALKH